MAETKIGPFGLTDLKTSAFLGYNDALGQVRSALTGAAQWTEAQIRDTGFIIPWLRAGQSDYFQMALQLPHDKKLDTDIKSLHAHVVGSLANTGKVKYTWAHTWVKAGDVIPAIGSWATNTTEVDFNASEQYKHVIHPIILDIGHPTSETYSSIFLVKITRVSSGGGADTYTGDIGLLYLDIHYESEKFGSIYEYADTAP